MWAAPLFAQATFSVSSSSTTGADIGATELTGQVVFTIDSGSSVAGSLQIKYSATITNDPASGIQTSGTGGLAGVAVSLDKANNTIRVDVPPGGVAPNRITVAGVRVALAGQNYTNVTATVTISTPGGNSILAGGGPVIVISSIQQPMTVMLPDSPITIDAVSTSIPVSLLIQEKYPAAFPNAVGQYGQTATPQLRINPFPSIPAGVTLTYPAKATSLETGAFFVTASGLAETVPRDDGSTTVVYQFSGVAGSDATVESFPFSIVVTVKPPIAASTLSFQATLLPVGIAVPNSDFPSTAIPRYTERASPDETDLENGTVRLAFPFLSQNSSNSYTGIALTNPIPFRVNVNLAAYDSGGKLISGPGITNPVDIIMPRSGQYAKLATEIFGASFNASTSGTIIATGSTSVLPGFYLEGGTISGPGLDGATAELIPVGSWTLPVVYHQGPSPLTVIQSFNPGGNSVNATLRLYDAAGTLKSTGTIIVPPGGTDISDIRNIFTGVDLGSITGGYVKGVSEGGLVVTENFSNGVDSNVLQGQQPIPSRSIVSHFVNGGGYTTELNLVNIDSAITESITLTALDPSGAVIGGGPLKISLPPGNQYIQTVDKIFPGLGSSFTTGYMQVDIQQLFRGPYPVDPPMAGSVRFTSGGGLGSTALPLHVAASPTFVFSHVAQNHGYFTGVAIINPNTTAATVNLDVLAADGTAVGSTSFQLQPGQKISKLLYELVPASTGQLGGYVRVQSNLDLVGFSIFGTVDATLLSAIPKQNTF
jgi:hypothetical protein